MCCSSQGRKGSDMTYWLNINQTNILLSSSYLTATFHLKLLTSPTFLSLSPCLASLSLFYCSPLVFLTLQLPTWVPLYPYICTTIRPSIHPSTQPSTHPPCFRHFFLTGYTFLSYNDLVAVFWDPSPLWVSQNPFGGKLSLPIISGEGNILSLPIA